MAAKTASKAATSTAAPISPPFPLPDPDDLHARSVTEIDRFLSWVRSSASTPYYQNLPDDAAREAFDALVDTAYLVQRGLDNIALEKFVARARANKPALESGLKSLKKELDGQKRAAIIIGAVGSLIETLLKLVIA